MVKYSIIFKNSVRKDLRAIPTPDLKRILATIEQLAVDPRPYGSIKLKGAHFYRIRQGAYRIIYEIRDKELIINVIKVGHRSAVYKSH